MDDPIKKIADSVIQEPVKEKIRKTNRTLSLNDKNFKVLQAHCVKHKKPVSDVVDKLIEAYIEHLRKLGDIDD